MHALLSYAAHRVATPFLLAACAFVLGCHGAEPPLPAEQAQPIRQDEKAVRATLTLLDAAGKESASFATGEPIILRLVVTNPGSEPRELSCSSSRTSDARISAEGRELWLWSHDQMFNQVITALELHPGESRAFDLYWHQLTNDGDPARPGTYRAEGWIPAVDGDIHTPAVTFDLR